IELHPKDRVKLKNNSGTIRFRKEGPIGKALFNHAKNNYLLSDFDQEDELIRFGTFEFSSNTLLKFKKKMEKFFQEAQDEAMLEAQTENVLNSYGLMIAYRPWENETLDAIKKKRPRN